MIMDIVHNQLGRPLQLQRGAHLYHMNDATRDEIYFIRIGHIKLYQQCRDGVNRIVDFLQPGDWVGIETLGQQRRQASALALTVCHIDTIPYHQLSLLMQQQPSAADRFSTMLSGEIEHQQLTASILRSASASQRVALFLLQRAGPAPLPPKPEGHIALPMSRQEISDYLGLTAATVSRTLSAMRRRGWVELRERGFVILQRTALEQLAASL
jgi:CRP/FNR family transcriptional regulator